MNVCYVLPQYSVHNFIKKPHCLKNYSSLWRSIYILNVKKTATKKKKKTCSTQQC